jgi:hypothetical protein
MKLNLGCGHDRATGFVNVDKFGSPDLVHDLEVLPWPWPDNSVEEIRLHHVLEHLGERTETFLGIMKEMYRICRDGATIDIRVPHPRHDSFFDDPTHVRAITPGTISLLSMKDNRRFMEMKWANSTLAIYLNVDFELTKAVFILDPYYKQKMDKGEMTQDQLLELARTTNNVILEYRMLVTVRKS